MGRGTGDEGRNGTRDDVAMWRRGDEGRIFAIIFSRPAPPAPRPLFITFDTPIQPMKTHSRFSYFRDKFQVFLLGLLFGLVLGGGFFVLKLDQYVKELSFYKSLTQKDDKTAEMLPEEKPETEDPKPKKVKKTMPSYDSSVTATGNEPMDNDTSSASNTNSSNPNEIVVIKDEQMASKTYSVINLEQRKSVDSIPAKETSAGSLAVEFWKSPLNYHGYKFNRNKLVLFGYGDQDLVAVFKMDNTTILKCLTGTFKIEPTTEFHQLDRITDESTLKRINESDISKIPGNRE